MVQKKYFLQLFQFIILNDLGMCNNSKSGMALR